MAIKTLRKALGALAAQLSITSRWQSADDEGPVSQPTSQERKTLAEFFGHPVRLPTCFFHHQLGGKPLMSLWASEVFECPNPDCGGTVLDPMRGRKRVMKFLAGILNDPWAGLPMVEPANEETKKAMELLRERAIPYLRLLLDRAGLQPLRLRPNRSLAQPR